MVEITDTDAPKLKVPPQPKGVPVFGNLNQLTIGDAGCLQSAMQKIMNEYGDFVRLRVLNQTFYLVGDAQLISQILLRNAEGYPKGETLDELREMGIGAEGIVETEGEQWLRQRRLCMKVFKPKFVEEMYSVVVSKSQEALTLLKPDGELEILDYMNRIALVIICEVAFSYESHCLKGLDSSDPILERQHFASEELMKRIQRTKYWKYMPIPANFKLKRMVEEQKKFYLSLIEERREKTGHDDASNDLLTLLLNARDEDGTQLSETELVDQMLNFLGAAHESVGSALHWLLYYLSVNPEIEARALEEIDRVYGDSETLPHEKLEELEYFTQIVHETLRLRARS